MKKAGEIWKTDSRKGRLTIRLLEDVDESKDTFFEAEIVDGVASYISKVNRANQLLTGMGTPGTVIDFRTSLTRFIQKVNP